MKSKHLVMSLLWVVVMILAIDNWCNGCLEEERFALLQLKASINYPNATSLPSWEEDDDHSDCCQWERVECNSTTRRVIKLSLSYTRDYPRDDYWYLNVSILLPFESLRSLDLSRNQLSGFVEDEEFDDLNNLKELVLYRNELGRNTTANGLGILSNLRNLEGLDLRLNAFDNSILPYVNKLSNLKILNLADNELNGTIDVKEFDGLSNLKELDLSANYIITINGSHEKSGMNNLEVLDLSYNELNGSIGSFLRELSSLKTLDLSGNNLYQGAFDNSGSHKNSGMNKLEVLDLSSNKLNGTIGSFLRELSSLKTLDLSYNDYIEGAFPSSDLRRLTSIENLYMDNATLNNDFFPSIEVLTSLRVLSLRGCILNDNLLVKGLCKLKNIQELVIKEIGLDDTLPWCLMNLTSLRLLDISSNHFIGNIAESPLVNLTSLEYLSISYNEFEIPISFKSFFNHSKLKFIESLDNKLLEEEDILTASPSFQLIGFRLSSPKDGRIIRSFPYFLYHQQDLVMVELSGFDISGKFPNWLLDNNTRMETLFLPYNSFRGPLSLPSNPMTNLLELDISNNHLKGLIPYRTPSFFPRIEYLNMSTNDFEGNIPSSFGDMATLDTLDLSNNRLSGEIPVHLAKDCWSLAILILSNNKLKGPMLPHQNNLTNLHALYLDGNGFIEIPHSLSASPFLMSLNMSHNQLVGPIPMEFCRLNHLRLLDLSANNITGSIPSCLNVSQIDVIKLSKNWLHGPFPVSLRNHTSLKVLDLSDNQFTGKIPNWIDNLSSLTILLLKNNRFEGNIPNQLCHLSRLNMIDLSSNNLSGSIPHCINDLTFEELPEKCSNVLSYRFSDHPLFMSLLRDLVLVREKDYVPFEQLMSLTFDLQIEFQTKGMLLSYEGVVLDLFSGINLSFNNLSGHIPLEIGNLSRIEVLNLTHNNLTGTIPETFSNLKHIESMDLSYNHLDGKIPCQLTELTFLSYFNLSFNNLSGSTPQRVAQFATFESSSYVENPLLCGEPLLKCNSTDSPPSMPRVINDREEESDFLDMDMDVLYMSFAGSYVTVVLAIVAVLYINPHWRRMSFHLIEIFIISCYFAVDNLVQSRCGFI